MSKNELEMLEVSGITLTNNAIKDNIKVNRSLKIDKFFEKELLTQLLVKMEGVTFNEKCAHRIN